MVKKHTKKKPGRPKKPTAKVKSIRCHIALEPARHALFQRAADDQSMDLSEWIRRAGDAAAKEQGIE